MVNKDQLRAVGERCSDFSLDESLYRTPTMSINDAGVKSCEICRNWDVFNQKCKIDVFDDILSSLDQS